MLNSLKNEQGFMLLEVMVSLAIISLGLIMAIQSFSLSQRAIKSCHNLNMANLLAQRRLWELRENPSYGTIIGGFEEPYSRFSFKQKVEPTEIEGLGKIKLTIYHNSIFIMELTAYLADRGLKNERERLYFD